MDLRLFGTGRALIGGAAWLTPRVAARAFALGNAADDPRGALVTRLFGARDLALGLAVAAGPAQLRRAAVRIGIAIDTADALATVLAARRGLHPAAAVLAGGGAVTFAVLGVVALREGGADPRLER
jgi:hypothetical protein